MDGNKTTKLRILIPEQYNITIAMQYSVVEMHNLIKNHSFNIQKYGLSMFFSTSQEITLFFTSLPTVCSHRFPCVKRYIKKSTSFLITSLSTL